MVTDNERREVARRLREKKAECEERGYPWMCDDLILALGYDHDYEAGDEIFDRLADLIEPPARCPHYMHPCCRTDAGGDYIDRDALLALAKGLDSKADDIIRAAQHARFSKLGPTMGEAKHEAYEWRCIARRIRDALGVQDA